MPKHQNPYYKMLQRWIISETILSETEFHSKFISTQIKHFLRLDLTSEASSISEQIWIPIRRSPDGYLIFLVGVMLININYSYFHFFPPVEREKLWQDNATEALQLASSRHNFLLRFLHEEKRSFLLNYCFFEKGEMSE